jgi:hypothetical protein
MSCKSVSKGGRSSFPPTQYSNKHSPVSDIHIDYAKNSQPLSLYVLNMCITYIHIQRITHNLTCQIHLQTVASYITASSSILHIKYNLFYTPYIVNFCILLILLHMSQSLHYTLHYCALLTSVNHPCQGQNMYWDKVKKNPLWCFANFFPRRKCKIIFRIPRKL